MDIENTDIEAVKLIRPKRFGDDRGFFSEVFKAVVMREAGLPTDWVQDNHSRSATVGTLRGLHFQSHPVAQDKLVRVVRGRIFDVAVDLRRSSPTYGHHVAVELSADNWLQLFVPIGFAHGFCTLEADTEVVYKVTAPYSPENDLGVAFDDPVLAIDWPVNAANAVLSDKDRRQPAFSALPVYFQ